MADEIERKFLVEGDGWRSGVVRTRVIKQGYLANTTACSIRVRVADQEGYISVKSAGLDIARKEYEYDIPLRDAVEMLELFCSGNRIEKKRFHVEHGGREWEVDVFEGENAGLVLAEIELDAVDEEVALPDWIGVEVSEDPRYLNSNLSTQPYGQWKITGHTP
jgi:adenylate cyclase